MNKLLHKKTNELTKKKKKGFTLIELIIVIAIIAILAVIAIPKFGSIREDSNKSADVADAKNIAMAVAKSIADNTVDYNPAVSNAALDNVGGANIVNQIDGIKATTTLRTATHNAETFVVDVDTDGNVTVETSGGTIVYPNPDDDFR